MNWNGPVRRWPDRENRLRGLTEPGDVLRKAAGIAAALCWILFGITAVIRFTAGDGGYLADRMLAAAPPPSTGLPEAEYPGVGRMIADYLTGREQVFQYTFADAEGNLFRCFHDYEAAHMADCRELIRLDGIVMAACLAGAAVLTAAGLVFRPGRPAFFRGMITGLRVAAVFAAVLGVWALVGFTGLFTAFHRLAFRNDGWLLDPRTDLLIRLMPEHFFTDLGLRGAVWCLLAPAAVEAAARIGLRMESHRTGRTERE